MSEESVSPEKKRYETSIFNRVFLTDDRLAWFLTGYSAVIVMLTAIIVVASQPLGHTWSETGEFSAAFYSHPYWAAAFLFALASLGVVYFIAVLRLNKVVGPFLRLQAHMTAVIDGKTEHKFKARDGDSMNELIEVYNKLVEKVVSRKSA